MPVLRGGALFGAQAAVFGRYLVNRHGYEFIGGLFDAQLRERPVDDAIRELAPTTSLGRMEPEWQAWLAEQARRGR
jgi:hypothetical protein